MHASKPTTATTIAYMIGPIIPQIAYHFRFLFNHLTLMPTTAIYFTGCAITSASVFMTCGRNFSFVDLALLRCLIELLNFQLNEILELSYHTLPHHMSIEPTLQFVT